MPTYEYECKKCFHQFEKFQFINDKPLKKCPKCQSRTLKRLIGSGGALIFRGSGFYITDYCRPKQTPANSTEPLGTKAAEQKESDQKSVKAKTPENSIKKDRQNNKKDYNKPKEK